MCCALSRLRAARSSPASSPMSCSLVGSCPDSMRREADGSTNARPYLARFVE
ncbi:hypothetical protein RSSE_c2906 [Ralstonia solanacearum]|nr:hypothetical protein RSSE_c2906 [Ralstonia solanacearum]